MTAPSQSEFNTLARLSVVCLPVRKYSLLIFSKNINKDFVKNQ